MASKLSKLFGTSPLFWMNIQINYDLYRIYQKEKDQVEQIKNLKTG